MAAGDLGPPDPGRAEVEVLEGGIRYDPLIERPNPVPQPVRRRRRSHVSLWLALLWLSLVLVCAVGAEWLPLRYDPNITADFSATSEPPSWDHLLGTDALGRDTLARVVYGARVSLVVGTFAILFGMAVGGTLGLVAGYFQRRTERIVMGFVDVLLAFPALVLALTIAAFLGASLVNVTLAVGVISVPAFARITRAATLSLSQREYVVAARSLGASDLRILLTELLPNVGLAMLTFGLVAVAAAIVGEASLSFLGLSIPPPDPSWGGMIAAGRTEIASAPYVCLIPAAVLFLTVLCLNVAGDRVRARFDVREASL